MQYESMAMYLISGEKEMTKLRSVCVFKKIAMRVEERKFDDLTKLVINQILDNPDYKDHKNDFRLKRRMDRHFDNLIEDSIVDLYKNKFHDIIFSYQVKSLGGKMIKFLEDSMPQKSYEGLEHVKNYDLKHCDDEKLSLLTKNTFSDKFMKSKEISEQSESKPRPLMEPEPEILNTEGISLLDKHKEYKIPDEDEDGKELFVPESRKKPVIKYRSQYDEGSHLEPMNAFRPNLINHELRKRVEARRIRERMLRKKKREHDKKMNNLSKYFNVNLDTLNPIAKVFKMSDFILQSPTKKKKNQSSDIAANVRNTFNFMTTGNTLLTTNMETEMSNTETIYNEVYDLLLIDYLTNMDPVVLAEKKPDEDVFHAAVSPAG